jgi:S1-C subfamily serine protease
MSTHRLREVSVRAVVEGRAAPWAPALLAAGLWLSFGPSVLAAPGPTPAGVDPAEAPWAETPRVPASRRTAARVALAKVVLPSDDWTFRPTVVVRRGPSQGSGTIIASVEGETLVLTASHVIRESGPISVELHRYNLGLERTPAPPGAWPRPIAAEVAAIDRAADLAVLRIESLGALPYVARLAASRRELAVDSTVTSIGIDLGRHLSSWSTPMVEALWFELNDNREERLFFITARVPEHGRTGGGLFLPDGELVGVCIGHAELVRGRRQGVFASRESIRRLLVDHGLDPVVARSEMRRARLGRASSRPPGEHGRNPAPSSSTVTPTGAVGPTGLSGPAGGGAAGRR